MAKKPVTQEDFSEIYQQFSDPIFRHCYFRVYSRERAVELMQEAFMKAWEYMSREETEVENIKAFLYRITNNLIIDEYRKKKSESLDRLMEAGFDPSHDGHKDTIQQSEAKEALVILEKLGEPDRTVIKMRFLEDLSPKEIAAMLGESENNISVKLHRAMKKLRRLYDL